MPSVPTTGEKYSKHKDPTLCPQNLHRSWKKNTLNECTQRNCYNCSLLKIIPHEALLTIIVDEILVLSKLTGVLQLTFFGDILLPCAFSVNVSGFLLKSVLIVSQGIVKVIHGTTIPHTYLQVFWKIF